MGTVEQEAQGCGSRCGCGNRALSSPADRTDTCRIPQGGSGQVEPPTFHLQEAAASAGKAPAGKRQLTIEFLYLDLSQCDPCRGAEANLERALAQVSELLRDAGVDVDVRKVHVRSQEQAEALGFASSPTIRINGRDIQPVVQESHCSSCSSLAGTDVNCRSWSDQGQEHSTPPPTLIIEALLREIYGAEVDRPDTHSLEGSVPENLQRFCARRKGRSRGPRQ